jgi:serine protease AprX
MITSFISLSPRRKAVWGPKRSIDWGTKGPVGFIALFGLLLTLGATPSAFAKGQYSQSAQNAKPGVPGSKARHEKLDTELESRADRSGPNDTTSVIVSLKAGAELPREFRHFARSDKLHVINGRVLELPNRLLRTLSAHPDVFDVHYNRPVFAHNFRTSLTVGTHAVRSLWGLSGAGVGVAVIDSGIASWHDDFTSTSGASSFPYGNQRVAAFVDFVNGQVSPYDDNGHGTHVSGIIAGNGYDSGGRNAGVAPDATLVSLKVLDANGRGTIGNIIAALDWVVANHDAYNIRVVNLSVGAGISESYWTDPLTLAAKRAVDAGVVVVAAAGNLGKNADGNPQYGGVTAPGNAPWVLTVGASSTMGTPWRGDDTMAGYSSRGPTYLDFSAKPDLVAPGTGTVSPVDPTSLFYLMRPDALLPGTVDPGYLPYLSMSGTSMAAPVVSGTVALMLQANPAMTPNGVKAVLQYTAESSPAYDPLTEGAGFLNTLGAVRLARFFATAQPGDPFPIQRMWSKHVIWGNHMLKGGILLPHANAWQPGLVWGASQTSSGDNIVWGSACPGNSCDNIVWGSDGGDNIVWGSGNGDNIVWGSGGGDNIVWGSGGSDNIVWGSTCGGANCDNIVWGSAGDNDNIVWGSDCGGADCDNIVWGSSDGSGSLWGTADPGDNIVWGSDGGDNIVWGSGSDDNVVWGSSAASDAAFATPTAASPAGGSPQLGFRSKRSLGWLSDDQLIIYIIQLETGQQPPTPPALKPATAAPVPVSTPSTGGF